MGRIIILDTGKNSAVFHTRKNIKTAMSILYGLSCKFCEGPVLGSLKIRVEYIYNSLENLYIYRDDM